MRALADAVQLPPERLIKAVLSTMDSWISEIATIEAHSAPGSRVRIMHLRRNMVQSQISFMRLVDSPQAEIEKALARVNDDMTWPRDEG